MEIRIEKNTIRLTGKYKKALQIYYNEDEDSFSMSVCQNGFEVHGLPTITFYKDHTVCINNLPQGTSFIN